MKYKVIFMLALLAGVVAGAAGSLMDGTALSGVYGRLEKADPNSSYDWAFVLDEELSDSANTLVVGTKLEMLPCSLLEILLRDAELRQEKEYRLWGSVTQFGSKNYVFTSVHFLPLSKLKAVEENTHRGQDANEVMVTSDRPRVQQSCTPYDDLKEVEENTLLQETQKGATPHGQEERGQDSNVTDARSINEVNDVITIPSELLEKIRKRPTVRTEQLVMKMELDEDAILAERAGYFTFGDEGKVIFTLDGLGRNVQDVSFEMLPSLALERALKELSDQAEKLRFKVTGILTRYEGEYYLLLNKSARVYGYGNLNN